MTTVIGISGSLRRGSFNAALLRAARDEMPEGATLEIGSIAGIPLYDADLERTEGVPDAVTALKEAVAGADGFLVVTPEYNNSVPGVLKNAIDWMTRPEEDIARIFRNRPVAMMGASNGRWGTILSQNAWLPVWRTLGTRLWTGSRLLVPKAGEAFSEDGTLTDDKLRRRLRSYLEGFVEFIGSKAP